MNAAEQVSQKLCSFAKGETLAIHNPQNLSVVAVQACGHGSQDIVQSLDGFGLPERAALGVSLLQTGEGAQYRVLHRVNEYRQVQVVNHQARGIKGRAVCSVEPAGKWLGKSAVGVLRYAAADDVGVQAKCSHG